jgi:hypothetical protein
MSIEAAAGAIVAHATANAAPVARIRIDFADIACPCATWHQGCLAPENGKPSAETVDSLPGVNFKVRATLANEERAIRQRTQN